MRIPLRLRVVAGLACSLLVLIAAAAHELLTVGPGSTPTPVPQDTSAFVQSLGVNTHLSYPGTPYYDQAQHVISALQYLGIKAVRDQSPAYSSDQIAAAADNTVAAAGIRFDALVPG